MLIKSILVVGLAASYVAAQPTITATAPAVRPGAAVTVTVTLTGANGPALQFFLPQLAGATYSATPGPALAANKTLTCAPSATPLPALFGCIVAGGVTPLVDGVIATITFTAPSAGSYALSISQQLGASGAADAVTVAAGAPLVLSVLGPCDVNGDGRVDSADVTLAIGNAIARLIAAAADVTGDGVVNVVDVQRVIVAANGGVCRVGL